MLIAELCNRTGLTRDTINHYDDIGLLNYTLVRAGNRNYRRFNEETVERLELIKIGARAGLVLREMKPILDRLMAGELCHDDQRGIVRNQINRLEGRIVELRSAQKLLEHLIDKIDQHEAEFQPAS